jgi:uncharacterized protein YbjT (DUF2867 family)
MSSRVWKEGRNDMILVVGGTGQLGARVVQLMCDRGAPVRCLVRPGSDDAALRDLDVNVVRGDLTDQETLPDACRGVQTVVATATIIARRLAAGRQPSIREVDEVGMAALVDAAEKAGVQRFVYMSYAGVDDSLGAPLDRAKLAIERRLRSSRMRTVIVRPDAFQEIHLGPIGRFDLQAGKVAVFGKGDTKHRWVAVDDVAQLVAALALEPDPPSIVEFGGPEALSRNEAIAIAERLTGRRLKRQRMPRIAGKLGMRLLDRPNDAVASIFGAGLHLDLVEADWDDAPLRVRGITPRSATEWLTQQANSSS